MAPRSLLVFVAPPYEEPTVLRMFCLNFAFSSRILASIVMRYRFLSIELSSWFCKSSSSWGRTNSQSSTSTGAATLDFLDLKLVAEFSRLAFFFFYGLSTALPVISDDIFKALFI